MESAPQRVQNWGLMIPFHPDSLPDGPRSIHIGSESFLLNPLFLCDFLDEMQKDIIFLKKVLATSRPDPYIPTYLRCCGAKGMLNGAGTIAVGAAGSKHRDG